jgi:hypothetical protein
MSADDNNGTPAVEDEEQVFGMYPIDDWAPAPEIPNQDRIFAAAAELQQAYEDNAEWTHGKPLSQSMVLLTLTAVEDGLRAIMDKWAAGSRQQPFPDMLEAIDEIMRIVSKEGKEEYEASLRQEKLDSQD